MTSTCHYLILENNLLWQQTLRTGESEQSCTKYEGLIGNKIEDLTSNLPDSTVRLKFREFVSKVVQKKVPTYDDLVKLHTDCGHASANKLFDLAWRNGWYDEKMRTNCRRITNFYLLAQKLRVFPAKDYQLNYDQPCIIVSQLSKLWGFAHEQMEGVDFNTVSFSHPVHKELFSQTNWITYK